MKCIFCLEEKQSSDEHVIPDSIGGHIHIKEVCVGCNSKLSNLVDDPFAKCSLIQLARYNHSLGGKRGVVPFPFGGISTVDTGQKVSVDRTFHPHSKRVLEITKLESGGFKVHFNIDASDRDKLEEMLGTPLRKILAKEFPEWSSEKCEEELEKILAHARAQAPVSEHKPLRKEWVLNLDDLLFEFLKIAYEMWFRHFGYPWVEQSESAEMLRRAILTRDPTVPIHGQLFSTGIDLPSNDPSINHSILLANGGCFIRLFNITCSVECEATRREFMLDSNYSRLTTQDFLSGEVREDDVRDLLIERLQPVVPKPGR